MTPSVTSVTEEHKKVIKHCLVKHPMCQISKDLEF